VGRMLGSCGRCVSSMPRAHLRDGFAIGVVGLWRTPISEFFAILSECFQWSINPSPGSTITTTIAPYGAMVVVMVLTPPGATPLLTLESNVSSGGVFGI